MKLWRDMQVSFVFTAARYSAPIGIASAVVGASYGISKATTHSYSKFEPDAPSEKRGFWYMLSGAMNTGLLD